MNYESMILVIYLKRLRMASLLEIDIDDNNDDNDNDLDNNNVVI